MPHHFQIARTRIFSKFVAPLWPETTPRPPDAGRQQFALDQVRSNAPLHAELNEREQRSREMDTGSIAVLAGILTVFAAFIAGLVWADMQTMRARREAEAVRNSGLWDWLTRISRREELEALGDSDVVRIAGEIGVSAGELRELHRRGPQAASRLLRRLEAVGLDPGKLAAESQLEFRDMQRLCALCDRHGRCSRDLSRDPEDSRWESYCPNAPTIRDLRSSAA